MEFNYEAAENCLNNLDNIYFDKEYIISGDCLYKLVLSILNYTMYKSSVAYYKNGYFASSGSMRSVVDIYRLCKSYATFDFTLEDLYKVLIQGVEKNDIYSWICLGAGRRVYGYVIKKEYYAPMIFNSEKTDELGFIFPENLLQKAGEYAYDRPAHYLTRINY